MHELPDHYIYVLQSASIEITLSKGTTQTTKLPDCLVPVNGPVTHKAEIIGHNTFRLVAADIYRPRS